MRGRHLRVFTRVVLARILTTLLIALSAMAPKIESQESPHRTSRPPQVFNQPEIQVEIQTSNERDTRIVLTNLSDEPLTACVLRISYLSENRKPEKMNWDVFLLNTSPLAKNANVSFPLGHAPGVPFLGKVEVAAAVWARGTMFGPPGQLKYIFTNRAYRARALDRVISLLQTGLQKEWTRNQYLNALDQEPKSVSSQIYGVKSTLQANPNLDASPAVRRKTIQKYLDSFSAEREALRHSKPDFTAPYIPN
jgi:hypothetical protein